MKLKSENFIRLSDLPKEIQWQLRATSFEIENSERTSKQNYVIVRRELLIEGKKYDAELKIGNCDIRQSPKHEFNDIINVWFDNDGHEAFPRVYSRDKAMELYCTADLDNMLVHLTLKSKDLGMA